MISRLRREFDFGLPELILALHFSFFYFPSLSILLSFLSNLPSLSYFLHQPSIFSISIVGSGEINLPPLFSVINRDAVCHGYGHLPSSLPHTDLSSPCMEVRGLGVTVSRTWAVWCVCGPWFYADNLVWSSLCLNNKDHPTTTDLFCTTSFQNSITTPLQRE